MALPADLFPLDRPVLTPEQQRAVLTEAAGWRSVMREDNKGPLTYETSRLLRAIGFPAVLELVTRAVQAEHDTPDSMGLSSMDWLQACNEEEGAGAAERIYNRAREIAGLPPEGGA